MMKTLKCVLITVIFASLLCVDAVAETDNGYFMHYTPKIEGECGILIEASTGRVLYASNAEARRAPASTTKIMTAIVVIENCNLNDTVTIPQAAVGIEGSSIYLGLGEKLTVKDLLYGLMLSSGNDAATALALHTAGSVECFAGLMNKKAHDLGLNNTNFKNPTGLPDDEHYTTAKDLAVIAAEAMKKGIFREIVSTERINIPWDGKEYDRVLINKNKMLFQYDGADGIKTGYTMAAGRCLAASATRDGMTLIAVVLNSSPMYKDCSAMLDYGFNNFKMQTVISKDEVLGAVDVKNGFIDKIGYISIEDIALPLCKEDKFGISVRIGSESVDAPVTKGSQAAYADVYVNNEIALTIELVYNESTGKNTLWARFGALVRELAG